MKETADGLFFIIGCGRSGTTLLQVMLDSHSAIALPNETHFYSVFRRWNRFKYGELESPDKLDKALEHVLENEHIKPIGLDAQRVRELVQGDEPSWDTLFLALLSAFREDRGVWRVGEKTPAHVLYLDHLYKTFPNAKFINMVRDPRAVIVSYMKAPFYKNFGRNPFHAIKSWSDAIDIHFDAEKRLDSRRYTSVRYEDLVEKPREELERLSAFLGVPFEEGMLEYHSRQNSGFLSGETHKLGTFKPVYKDSTQSWRKDLTPAQIALYEAALGDRMRRLGYETDTGSSSLLTRMRLAYLFVAYKTRVRVRRLLQLAGVIKQADLGGIAEAGKGAQ